MEGTLGPTPGHSKSGSRKGFRYHDHWILWAMDDIPAEKNHAAGQNVRETKSHYGSSRPPKAWNPQRHLVKVVLLAINPLVVPDICVTRPECLSVVRSAEVSNQDHRTVAEWGFGLRTNQLQSKNHS
ncbi:uncharacterized protein B0T23DRAFT_404379 [Neurospora hispaniola]|uniref:Uncharacterized protein n=1 Tax=Neurospora hispaniola TaxID=588809 RepID=A0AAJ0MRJ9_9PEZI|nr:hypothetical protein B0T23DRAFT_404379 [Neurospora hispaniola]